MTRFAPILITILALILSGYWMKDAATEMTWYRNLDMNIHNVDDALSFNAGNAPRLVDQPGLPLKYLLALDYRVRHFTGHLPVHDMNEFSASHDVLPDIAKLIHVGRTHSQILVLFTILLAAGFTLMISRSAITAAATAALLAGSEGLLFHGLMTRPELLCVTFGNVAALGCTWWGMQTQPGWRRTLGLMLAGVFIGLSVISKIPGMWYLIVCGLWCFLAPHQISTESQSTFFPLRRRAVALILPPTFAAAAAYLTLSMLTRAGHPAESVVHTRISILAIVVGVLPWLLAIKFPGRFLNFYRERGQQGLLVLAGAALTIPCTYFAISLIMPSAVAAEYTGRVLHVVFNPGGLIDELATNPEPQAELYLFLSRNWFLFSTAVFVGIAVAFNREVPSPTRKLVGLMTVCAFGITLLMSKRYFSLQYPIYCEVPLILAIVLGLHALWISIPKPTYVFERYSAVGAAWVLLVIFVAATPSRLRKDHLEFQWKQNVPAYQHPLALIFLYHHDAHTDGYLKSMAAHFDSKANFTHELEKFINETGGSGIRPGSGR